MKKHIDVSLIVPAFNEERIIADTLRQIAIFVAGHKQQLGSVELIVVAAGNDKTADIARGFEDRFDAMQVLEPKGRAGKGRDVRAGFLAAGGTVELFLDADLPTPLPHILTIVEALRGDADVAIGVRRLSKIHKSLFRTLFSLGSNWLTRLLLFPTIRDTQCGFKGFTKSAAKQLFSQQARKGWGFDVEVLQLAKEQHLKVAQITIADWHETRDEDLRGDNLIVAGLRTLGEVLRVRLSAWGRSLARHSLWWVIVAMITAGSLTLYIGLGQSVWFDEAYTIALAKRPFSELLHLTAVDVHPPLHYLLVKAWAGLFGWGELALRALGALIIALTVGTMALLIKKLFNIRVMLWALPFITFAPFVLRYGFEIRMYALAALIALLATYVLVSTLQARGKKAFLGWGLYALLVAAGVYTLYYTSFIWIAHLLWLTFAVRPKGQPVIKQPWMAAYVGAIVLFLPWLPQLVSQLRGTALAGITESIMVPQLTTIASFSLLYAPEWALTPWNSLLLIALFIGAVWLVTQTFRAATAEQERALKLFLFYWLVPLGLMLLISLPPLRPMFVERYISPFIIAGYALLGVCIGLCFTRKTGKKWPVGVLALVLFITLCSGMLSLSREGNYNYQRLSRPHAKQMMASISDCRQRLIIADDPLLYFELHYYRPQGCRLAYHSRWPIEDKGGFAPIYQRAERVGANQLHQTRYLSHVFTGSEAPKVHIPATYRLISSKDFGGYHLRNYATLE
ncbi:MAG TPA: glycosyltransferase [Candidatus Saccharimonadales bacterium]